MKKITISKKKTEKKNPYALRKTYYKKKGFLLLAPPGTCAGVKKIVYSVFVYVNQV